MRTRRRENTG
jgi:hypothetical protein